MGSFGDGNYSKGDNPALDWVIEGIDEFNAQCAARARAAPMWRKLLARLGYRRPHVQWQKDHWYDDFRAKED